MVSPFRNNVQIVRTLASDPQPRRAGHAYTPCMTTTRRQFISASLTAAGALAIGARGAHAADDAYPIIDTHTHFYDTERPGGVPWPSPNDKLLYRPVLPDEFVTLTKSLGVTGTVVVEAVAGLEDNAWMLDLAKKHTVIKGIVGKLDPADPQFAAHVKRFAADPLYRGIRNDQKTISAALNDASMLLAYKTLAEADLALDALGGPDQLPDVARLAEAIPSLRIVINHLTNNRIDGKPPKDEWVAALRTAAAHRNVYMKVSALVEATGARNADAPKDVDYYRPELDVVYQTFGPDRVIYGSNWPVCLKAGAYKTVFDIVHAYFTEKGRDVAMKYFAGNAKAAYKWVER